MTEHLARLIADELCGTAYNSGGNLWLVRFEREDGRIVILGNTGIMEYASQAAYDDGKDKTSIYFAD